MISVAAVVSSTSNSKHEVDVNSSPQGYIVSHSYYNDKSYNSNIDSTLTLVGIECRQININFVNFDLDDSRACQDYLLVTYRKGRERLCDNSDIEDFRQLNPLVNLNTVKLTFITKSGGSPTKKGFLLYYNGKLGRLIKYSKCTGTFLK